jgi:hypothetical protein
LTSFVLESTVITFGFSVFWNSRFMCYFGYASQFLSRSTAQPFLRAYVLASVAVLNVSVGIMSPLNDASDHVSLLFLNSNTVVFIISCVVLRCLRRPMPSPWRMQRARQSADKLLISYDQQIMSPCAILAGMRATIGRINRPLAAIGSGEDFSDPVA